MNKTVGRKRIETKITSRKKNGGIHDTRAWNNIKGMIESNDYKEARLFHLVFYPLQDNKPNLKDYQSTLQGLCLKLKRAGIPHKWRACLELDEEKESKGKGLHFHVFLMLENDSSVVKKKPSQFLSSTENGWFRTMHEAKGVAVYHAAPQSDIHLTANGERKPYATLPKTNQAKIDDCIDWISYLVKSRSKSPDHKTTYFSSRDRKPANNSSTDSIIEAPTKQG